MSTHRHLAPNNHHSNKQIVTQPMLALCLLSFALAFSRLLVSILVACKHARSMGKWHFRNELNHDNGCIQTLRTHTHTPKPKSNNNESLFNVRVIIRLCDIVFSDLHCSGYSRIWPIHSFCQHLHIILSTLVCVSSRCFQVLACEFICGTKCHTRPLKCH